MFTLKEIWRYPVKSMRGEKLRATHIDESGLKFDRAWAIRDDNAKAIRGAKYFPELLQCASRYPTAVTSEMQSAPSAIVTLPNGSEFETSDPRLAKELSDLVGKTVSVWPVQPKENKSHYLAPEMSEEEFLSDFKLRNGIEDGDPMPAFANMPTKDLQNLLKFATPPGTYFDGLPLSILTRSAIRDLRAQLPNSQIALSRFRSNLLFDDPNIECGVPEFGWVGKRASLSEAELSLDFPCPRCVMVGHTQGDLPEDRHITRKLIKEYNFNFSVLASIVKSGSVSTGDEFRILD